MARGGRKVRITTVKAAVAIWRAPFAKRKSLQAVMPNSTYIFFNYPKLKSGSVTRFLDFFVHELNSTSPRIKSLQ